MRTLSTLLGTAAVLMGLAGCVSTDPDDILTTITSATLTDTMSTTDDTMGTETGDMTTTAGDGDGDTTTGDGDGDGPTGCFNCPCGPAGECDDGLECDVDSNTCQLPPDTTTTDTTTGEPAMWGDGPYYGDPAMGCQVEEVPLMDGQLPVAGGHCSPIAMCSNADCTNDDACPPAPDGVAAGGGVVWTDGMGGNYCGLICELANNSSDCPAGSTCKDLMAMDLGVCTYP